jgi:DNA repair protein RadC
MAVSQSSTRIQAGDTIIRRALHVLAKRLSEPGAALTSPRSVREYLRLRIGAEECERFVALWLNNQHQVVAIEELSRGTITQTSVYPREVVKSALRANAAAVIFAHNHPSGLAEPSLADKLLTRNLEEALELVEVKVLDHFVIGASTSLSFAERGLLPSGAGARVGESQRPPATKRRKPLKPGAVSCRAGTARALARFRGQRRRIAASL